MKWYTYEEIERYIQIIERKGGRISGVYWAEMHTFEIFKESQGLQKFKKINKSKIKLYKLKTFMQ